MKARFSWEIAREPDLVESVAALDVLLRHRHVRAGMLRALAAEHPRSRASTAIRLADGRAESPCCTRRPQIWPIRRRSSGWSGSSAAHSARSDGKSSGGTAVNPTASR
ncbi:hypothetical protein [Cryptosporangium phraense]|uniref:Uncharacterized protein n=1 Tax=Cryptosporangium phraense TaxID=2593070 RepID=A0A545AW06_9ACTN|nr:hypothetical protein [Cryptosporangium phraense]TQS45518.1 hypothetical protein FL583_07205 [Cryptosporangium phraense]